MAQKASGGDKKPKTRKAKAGEAQAGPGHNLAELKKKAAPALKEILAKFKSMESDMGTYRGEIKDLYEKHANSLGVPRKIMRMLVAEVRAAIRLEEDLAEMEQGERETLEALEASLAGTPFGKYFGDKLAAADAVKSEDA